MFTQTLNPGIVRLKKLCMVIGQVLRGINRITQSNTNQPTSQGENL